MVCDSQMNHVPRPPNLPYVPPSVYDPYLYPQSTNLIPSSSLAKALGSGRSPQQEMAAAVTVKVGPWGGSGGGPFDVLDAPGTLEGIRVRHGAAINAVGFLYESEGRRKWTPYYGGGGGDHDEITLEPEEYLTSVSGYYGNFNNIDVVRSLTFGTNMSTYGPYGPQEGTAFSIPLEDGKVVSFFGRSGALVDAIGIYVAHV